MSNNDRTAVLTLRFDSRDVIIKLSDAPEDSMLIHSAILQAHCPALAPYLKPEWGTTHTASHPATGADTHIHTLHLRNVDDMFLLGNEVYESPIEIIGE